MGITVPTHVAAVSTPDDDRPTLIIDGEPVAITNFRSELPPPAPAAGRVAFVKAAQNDGLHLDDDGLHAVARALVDPHAAAAAVRSQLLTDEVVGPANLKALHGHVYLTEILPGLQPRAGAAASAVALPKVIGGLGPDKEPQATITLEFRDGGHLVEYLAQVVRQTRTMGRHYEASILTRRVSQPVLLHPGRIEFEDGSPGFDVVVARDGLTRIMSSWAGLLPGLSADELAAAIVKMLLATKSARKATDTQTSMHARGRAQVLQDLRARFAQGAAGPSEDAIRIGQTLILPARVLISFESVGAAAVGAEYQFDDAVQALVASVHGEFEPWEGSAADAAAIQRALPRAVHDEAFDSDVAELAVGRHSVKDVPKIFGPEYPATALWRAVLLASWFCAPTEFASLKRHLRDLLGVSRIYKKDYAEHLMTLIDLPWRYSKAASRQQAARAWGNGGPIPHDIIGVLWDPVPTDDFTTLVPKALAGDTNARCTLQVAGGIALVTDKVLLSNTGSAFTAGLVPFRSNVNDVVADLGRVDNTAGLWQLARAANAFRAGRRAANSYTPQEALRRPPGPGAYTIPWVDPKNPAALTYDNAGQLRPLTTYHLVYLSNPQRAEEEKEEAKKKALPGTALTETAAEKMARLRGQVVQQLQAGHDDFTALVDLSSTDPTLQPALGDRELWQNLVTVLQKLNGLVFTNEPPSPSLIDSEPEDEPDEEEYADEDELG
ncbi:hypothetical protein [Actinoplanes aureus]|uniref:Uncharacterized protein n=1 Tax=Actinoplanes aureus TaxID=2792083 RepID=A0A931G266_9ACTN|nr:hypothetical protein [Actinoplanes aureus]MBG0567825.1 hypothetical protein [Actinoplanes aureus]